MHLVVLDICDLHAVLQKSHLLIVDVDGVGGLIAG